MEAQLQQVRGLVQRWAWHHHEDGDLSAVLVLKVDGTSVRVWLSETFLELDAHAGYVPLDAGALTGVLMSNHNRTYKARAVRPEGEWVPIYVTARFAPGALQVLAAHLWDAFEAAFLWRGELNRLRGRLSGAAPGVSA